MAARRRNLFILLFVAGLIAASAAAIATKPTKLGLDLRGGIELIYQGRPTPQQPEVDGASIDRSIDIIRERIDELGVAEPEVARLGATEISVSLPDITDAQRAIDQVGTTAQLYFYDWEPNVIGKPGSPNPSEDPFSNLYDAVRLAAKQKPECRDCTLPARFYLFEKQVPHKLISGPETNREDLFVTPTGEKLPREGTVIEVPEGTLVVAEQPLDPNTGEPLPEDQAPPGYFVIRDRPSLSGTDITDPKPSFDQNNQPTVAFGFSDEGREKFQDVTREIALRGAANALPGENPAAGSDHFAVVLDNEVKSRPIINYAENPDGIDGRTGAEISGLTQQEAEDLATNLQIGALPITLKLISQTQVSATLGEQALDQGLKAGVIGLILVILFLLAYYRFLGLVATIGLAVFAVFFFALVKLIPITLTLPGIAGLILTIGVAADSNIIIFERIKEEVRAGRSTGSAIAAGYRRGIATIVDANVITFLTAFILFVLATSGVKGFAFMLGIGTIVSLLTAVVFTQAFLGLFGRGRVIRSRRLLGAGEERARWRFDFMGASRWFFSMSGVILSVGAISLAVNQLNLGIDFESGTRVKAALSEPTDENGVRDALEGAGIAGAEIQQVEDPVLGENVFAIKTSQLGPDKVDQAENALDRQFGIDENGFDSSSVGPTFGEQVARSAVYAIIFSLLVISGYIALRFEAKYAVPVLIAVAHDILITAGVYSLSEREVTSATVAAFLTILGYSLYDTIIVFDRIRENVPRMPRAAFSQIVNRSMSEVLTRSLITGLSSVFLVTVLLIFGGDTLKDFAFAMMVGIASGTYSSIFIASPVLTAWKEREPAFEAKRERIAAAMGGRVPAFTEEIEVARVDDAEPAETEEPAEAEEPVPAAAIPAAGEDYPAVPPAAGTDGTDAEQAQLEEEKAGVSSSRQKKSAKRRQRQRRRKHGRHR